MGMTYTHGCAQVRTNAHKHIHSTNHNLVRAGLDLFEPVRACSSWLGPHTAHRRSPLVHTQDMLLKFHWGTAFEYRTPSCRHHCAAAEQIQRCLHSFPHCYLSVSLAQMPSARHGPDQSAIKTIVDTCETRHAEMIPHRRSPPHTTPRPAGANKQRSTQNQTEQQQNRLLFACSSPASHGPRTHSSQADKPQSPRQSPRQNPRQNPLPFQKSGCSRYLLQD